MRLWTDLELQVVRSRYKSDGAKSLAKGFGRTPASVTGCARRLGITQKPRWTENESFKLGALWDLGLRLDAIAAQMGRTEKACLEHAAKLGFRVGRPEGFECLSAATARVGFSNTSVLRRILRAYGVVIQIYHSDAPCEKGRRKHFVDPIAVDDAVEKWMKTEPVATAARRLSMASVTLRKKLRAVGVAEPGGHGKRRHWRVTPEEIARALTGLALPSKPPKSSAFIGVTWNKVKCRWQAQRRVGGRNTYLGVFETEQEAAAAYRASVEQRSNAA